MKTTQELIRDVYQIQLEHEKEPASEQQTKVCLMLSDLRRELEEVQEFDEDATRDLTAKDHELVKVGVRKILAPNSTP